MSRVQYATELMLTPIYNRGTRLQQRQTLQQQKLHHHVVIIGRNVYHNYNEFSMSFQCERCKKA
jgi:hypothetical protein